MLLSKNSTTWFSRRRGHVCTANNDLADRVAVERSDKVQVSQHCEDMQAAGLSEGSACAEICSAGRQAQAGAFWRNVPAAICGSKLGAYEVLKKWLFNHQRDVFGPTLSPEEVLYFSKVAKRMWGT